MKHLFLLATLWLFHHSVSQAQGFVYRPNNPAFGGNTYNYSWMLSSAQAQDLTKDPTAAQTSKTSAASSRSGANSGSTASDFAASLQRQLLNNISRNILGNQFGEGSLKPGTYQFGDTQVDISQGSDGLVIRIVDGKGGESTITVPYY
jgi:curli production assembly/transport component CsgF